MPSRLGLPAKPEALAEAWSRDVLRPLAEKAAGSDGRISSTEAAKAQPSTSLAADNLKDAFVATGSARPSVTSVVDAGEKLALAAAKAAAGSNGVLEAHELAALSTTFRVDFTSLVEVPLRFSESVLADVMADFGLTDRQALLSAAQGLDDGNGYLKRSELEAAAKALASGGGTGGGVETGIISDLDSTIIPAHATGAPVPKPFPGIAALLKALEFGAGGTGKVGDVHYVTARSPDRVVDIPEYLSEHGVPDGSIDTGTTSVPWVAQKEKVKDITARFEANPDQKFVLFGDTKHRDPEVYREIMAKYPDRVLGVFINGVNQVDPARVAGMNLVTNYAQAAAILFGDGVLTETQARGVIAAARAEGLTLTNAQVEALLDAQR